jgi:hypothetical protein
MVVCLGQTLLTTFTPDATSIIEISTL